METKKLIDYLKTNEWVPANATTGTHGACAIAIKGNATESDACDINDLKYIMLEFGINSGIEDHPLTILRVKFDFNNSLSSDPTIIEKAAFSKLPPLPTPFYLKAVAFGDSKKEYKEGYMPVSINFLPY